MQTFNHIYKGIVIQNDDPEQMGRVKVFVPEISMTLYKKWNEDRDNDKFFTEIGGNLNSAITADILLRLKNSLPWAMVKQPIFGMGSSTLYHNDENFAEIANDEDNSTQHDVINKNPAASSPANNQQSKLQSELAKTNPSSSASTASSILNSSNTNASPLPYVENSASATSKTVTTQSTKAAASTGTSSALVPNGNVSSLVITFNPSPRNVTGRRFSSSASLSVEGQTVVSGSSNATGITTGFTNAFTGSTSAPTSLDTSTAAASLATFSPSITYSSGSITFTPSPRNVTGRRFTSSLFAEVEGQTVLTGSSSATGRTTGFTNNFSSTTQVAAVSQSTPTPSNLINPTAAVVPIANQVIDTGASFITPTTPTGGTTTSQADIPVSSNIPTASTAGVFASTTLTAPPHTISSDVSVSFNPSPRNKTGRRFSSTANLITIEGDVISVSSNATGIITPFTISKTQIANIDVTMIDVTQPVDFSHPSLGALGQLLSEYTNPNSVGITSTPIAPPATIEASGSITFTPSPRNKTGRRFTSSITASVDGTTVLNGSSSATGRTTGFTNNFSSTTTIPSTPNAINPTVASIPSTNNPTSTATTPATVTPTVNPPTTVESSGSLANSATASSGGGGATLSSDNKKATIPFNRGGGGGELFQLVYSNLLPFMTLLNTLVGNTNPDSKLNNNYKRKITNGSDPHERCGVNLQTSAFCGPPMRSPTQNNKAKGMISIPAVGAHVSVYFDKGDPLYPIIDGVYYSQEDFLGLHDATDDSSSSGIGLVA